MAANAKLMLARIIDAFNRGDKETLYLYVKDAEKVLCQKYQLDNGRSLAYQIEAKSLGEADPQ